MGARPLGSPMVQTSANSCVSHPLYLPSFMHRAVLTSETQVCYRLTGRVQLLGSSDVS